MAVKPITLPQIWSSNAVYTTGPFIGLPNKAFPTISPDGHRPGSADPTAAEFQNYQQHWSDKWIVDWVAQGSATASANTHIVETDSDGRTEQIGYDLIDTVDRVAADWSTGNINVPAFRITTSGGGGVHVFDDGGIAFLAENTASGFGFVFNDSITSSANAFSAFVSGLGAMFQGQALSLGTRGIEVTTFDKPALIAATFGTAASIRMTPKSPPNPSVPGDLINCVDDDNLWYWDSANIRRIVWATEGGLLRRVYNSVNLTSNVSPNFTIISLGLNFIAGRRYTIKACLSLGRPTGSTQIPNIVFHVGASNAPAHGTPYHLFFNGPDVIESSRTMIFDYLAPATQLFFINIGTTAGTGTGNLNFGPCWMELLGAF